MKSKGTLSQFDPRVIPYQYQVIKDVRKKFDYKLGTHEIMLSGSIGSAKSILMAHLVVTHCSLYPKARVCLGRRALVDIKDTIFREILEHIEEDLTEGVDYFVNENKGYIRFKNKSEIISRSWADRKTKKGRSLKLSMLVVEELTENDDRDKEAIIELRMRLGRLPNIPEKLFICATNPDDPSHWAYKYFIQVKSETRHVYYSKTIDNPFLPASYREQIERELDPKMARRMIHGEWLSITGENIYHSYSEKNELDEEYEIDFLHPVRFAWDFNIGEGKPMSCVFFQYIDDTYHFFDEIIIDGARTTNVLEEGANRGIWDMPAEFICHGDASGKHRDTRQNLSDYDIIDQYFDRYKTKKGRHVRYKREVPVANPEIRKRHNTVNAYMMNSLGEIRLFVYSKCKVLREGWRLTKLKKGAAYIEDDTKYYQHCTTAAGYGITWLHTIKSRKTTESREL